MKHITRTTYLTDEEAEKYNKIREQADKDLPDLIKQAKKLMKKKNTATVDNCVISHKPIKQYHIDNKKVIEWGKGRAFIDAIKKNVPRPPSNPVVITGNDLDEVTIRFEAWHFPYRIKILGKEYSTFPNSIYLHNAEFKLVNSGIDFTWLYSTSHIGKTKDELPETEDQCVKVGTVTYVKKSKEPVDKEEKA